MHIQVRYQVLAKSTISSISFNQRCNLLAVVPEASDTVLFFSFQSNRPVEIKQMFKGDSKPSASGCVSWSPCGRYIAVAGTKVEVWKLENNRLAPFRVINQGYIEIKCAVWSQDSAFYICYGINPKDSPLSINIRNLETSQLKQIYTDCLPIMCSFDPFGKYIAVVTLDNVLILYDSRTLQKIKRISMAETPTDLPTLKEKRMGDWSPEYGYFACPNLNDARISTGVIYDRNKGFEGIIVLVGHQALINCMKFNPCIYEYQGQISFILAMGDSSGCLSLWRIFSGNKKSELICLMSSPIKAEESVQNLEWNNDGDFLIVSLYKKYSAILEFKKGDFGRKLEQYQKLSHIVSVYGSKGASDITGTKLQVFGQSNYNETILNQEQKNVMIQASFTVQGEIQHQNLIKTKQQTLIIKQGTKEKKRIIPSRIISESQAALETQSASQPHFNNNSVPILKFPTFKLAPLKQQIKREFMLQESPFFTVLTAQLVKDLYILTIKKRQFPYSATFIELNKRYFGSDLKTILVNRQFIYIVTNEKLFVFDLCLKPADLPVYIGQVAYFAANEQGTIYYMLTNGVIRGFNFLKRDFVVQTSSAYLFMDQQSQQQTNPFSRFIVQDGDNDRLQVELKKTLQRYFYCKQTNSWIQLDFNKGFYKLGHSIHIPQNQNISCSHFYSNLINSSLALSKNKQNPVSQIQAQLLYFTKYNIDIIKHKDSLTKYLIQLKKKGDHDQLRVEIEILIKNPQLIGGIDVVWSTLSKIGGRVIEQFGMLK